jgi:membrane protein YdbS with pleckstrin-like domain
MELEEPELGDVEAPMVPAAPPLLADGHWRELHPDEVKVGWIVGAIVTGAFVVAAVVGWLLVWLIVPWPSWAKLAVGGGELLLLVGLALISIRWPRLEHRRTRWRLDDIGLEIRRGVVWRTVISVPISRVQHTDVNQGPIQRRFGLATLVVHTAGTESASVELGGLTRPTAVAVRDFLLASSAEDGS